MLAFFARFAIAVTLFCTVFCPFPALTVKADSRILVEYFYQPNCEECQKISAFILPQLKQKFNAKVTLKKYDLSVEKNFLLLISILDKHNDNSNQNVYMIINRKRILGGYDDIEKQIFKHLEAFPHNKPEAPCTDIKASKNSASSIGSKLKIATVITAGLIDGINPCVFSTLIFFMSLLAVSKIKGRRLFAVGVVYCIACFITYLLLGMGIFKIIQTFTAFASFKFILNYSMAAVLMLFAFLSLRDVWRFITTGGNAKKVTLQMPDKFKKIIHKIMRQELKKRYLLGGAFLIGVAVTLLESVCTGQVYVPTLVLLSNESGIFSKWFALLLLYNVMFVIPLIAVFILMHSGISVLKAIRITRTNLIIGKILLFLFFLALAIILLLI